MSMSKATVADIIQGVVPGEMKRWRFEKEVPARSGEYKRLHPESEVSKQLAEYFGLERINDPSPDGHVIIGVRERGWKRPLVVKDTEGNVNFVTEDGVRRYFKTKK